MDPPPKSVTEISPSQLFFRRKQRKMKIISYSDSCSNQFLLFQCWIIGFRSSNDLSSNTSSRQIPPPVHFRYNGGGFKTRK